MDQVNYFKSHPPRCIAGFNAKPVELQGVGFDGHPSASDFNIPETGVKIDAPEHINPVFALSCTCGESRHYIHGYQWRNPDYNNVMVFLSPLVLECASCQKKTDLIDTDIHGYDAELVHGSATMRGEGEHAVYECQKCGRQPYYIYVRFEYSDDLFDGDFEDFDGRQQDLFSWFTLLGKCSKCNQLQTVTDYECS